jgi:ribonuclease E
MNMPKKMLINALHAEEARVAIVEDGLLVDLGIEIAGREQTRGNVYKGVVVRVEPGLQAAFIDIGLKKLGFLQMGELHPEFWQWRDDVPPENRNRRPRIQEVLRRGQELIVQVEKGERDMKGAAVTSYLSLPGRYMVLMPGSDSAGVSRKVEAEGERKKLKEMAAELNIPEGIGFIIRTEALGKKQTELAKDFHYLLKLNESIREAAARVKGAALIYQESDLIIRTIRDYFTSEIDEVLVDSVEVYEQAKAFFKEVMPRMASRVKLHQEKRPIFSRYQLEEQIDSIYEKKVQLKSGGSLVIEPAEALVSIDVNSGKSTGEKGVEDTAFKTNMEAAEEAARQLRLRDLGGLIVIDFIDMRDRKHNADVEKTLKHALKSDKARVTVGKISQFGLLEMSRQRIRQTANEAVYLECPHCEGRGRLKSVEAMALSFLRKVHAAAAKGTIGEVRGGLPLEVAYYLLNRKKKDLARIEADYDIEVTLKGKPSFLMNQIELELVKREKGGTDTSSEAAVPLVMAQVFASDEEFTEEETVEVAEETLDAEESATEAEGEQPEAGKKRKRRRGKKKPVAGEAVSGEEAEAAEEPVPVEDEAAGEDSSDDADEEQSGAESPTEVTVGSAPKKRKRRRKKSKAGAGATPDNGAPATPELAGTTGSDPETEADESGADVGAEAADEAATEAGSSEEAKKKRRRRRRGGAKRRTGEVLAPEESVSDDHQAPDAEPATPASAVTTAAPVPAAEAAVEEATLSVPKKPRAPRPRKKVAEAPSPEAQARVSPDVAAGVASEAPVTVPAKRTRSARKPAAAVVPVVAEAPPVAAVTDEGGESAPKPKPKRAVRKAAVAENVPAEVPPEAVTAGEEAAAPKRKRPARKKAEAPADDAGGGETTP